MKSAINRIRKQFPQVEQIVNATKPIRISVTAKDSAKASKKDPNNCALAVACKRQKLAEAVIIGIGVSYLISGDTATRYRTSHGVGREITSFDRHHDFAAGEDYLLASIKPQRKRTRKPSRGGRAHYGHIVHNHKTADIRTTEL